MLSSVNSNQPSFQGMYIIKGKAKTVDKASKMIYEKCNNEWKVLSDKIRYQITGKPIPEYVEGFTDYNTLNLVPICSENQPLVHKLISTNEHVANVCNWYRTMQSDEIVPLTKKTKKVKVINTPYGTKVIGDIGASIKDLRAKMQMIQQELAPYLEAEKAAKNGNPDKMSDFLIDCMRQIKQRLQEVRDLATVPYTEPEILNAKDVINAIEENRFNFITGEIK